MINLFTLSLSLSPRAPRDQVVTSLESLFSSASPTASVDLVVRFGTSTGDGDFGSIAAKKLFLRMTASILTSETTKFAVILGQQVRAGLFHGSILGLHTDHEAIADVRLLLTCECVCISQVDSELTSFVTALSEVSSLTDPTYYSPDSKDAGSGESPTWTFSPEGPSG